MKCCCCGNLDRELLLFKWRSLLRLINCFSSTAAVMHMQQAGLHHMVF